jgi:hypothetical protein
VITVRVLAAVISLSLVTAPAAAQVSLLVLDGQGRPVPAVRIEVFGRGELIEVVSTSEQGLAELSGDRWSEVRRVSLTHLGYGTSVIQVEDLPPDGMIRLEPEATEIEGFIVDGRDLCPVDGDGEARELWARVAARYSADTGTRAWLAYFSRYGGPAREDDLHRVPDSGLSAFMAAGGSGVIHGGDHVPRPLDDRIVEEGYAWPPLVVGGTTGRRALEWDYPQLDWRHAYHFASPVFGQLHDFAVLRDSDGETTLAFCDRGEGVGATISGTLSLIPGEAFVAAEWRFETPDSREDAGGWVTFASLPDPTGLEPHLVSSRGLFYRTGAGASPYPDLPRSYVRFGTTGLRWHLLPSADQPCNTGISFFPDPPDSARGLRFAECVAEHWGSAASGVP